MITVAGTCENHDYKIEVTATKITTADLVHKAAQRTSWNKVKDNINLDKWYRSEHSPIRTQEFWIDLIGLPHFVHTHFVRHHVGIQPFVKTGREDRGMIGEQTRWTSGEMSFMINAQALINMARLRLCTQAHVVTRQIFQAIKDEIAVVDPHLAKYMVRECVYRNGYCKEFKPCGFLHTEEALTEIGNYIDPSRTLNMTPAKENVAALDSEKKCSACSSLVMGLENKCYCGKHGFQITTDIENCVHFQPNKNINR